MSAKQIGAYKATQKMVMTGREIEAAALTQAAIRLTDCQNDWDAPDHDQLLQEALRVNQTIWSIFQAELTKADNPLPKTLRQDILSLSVFIDQRILDIMAYPSPEKLNAIININMILAEGLRGDH
jgi:flagellar biosynthesis activator protein FlaF